jgi:hypothetical protein
MASMIIHLNGWPGVGKLTIARLLRDSLGARLLDNHTVFNVAFALTEFRSPEFYAAARTVRDAAFDCASFVPPHVPIIMTNAVSRNDWGEENWNAVKALARRGKRRLLAVVLSCEEAEQAKRIASPERRYLGKLNDPKGWSLRGRELIAEGADFLLRLDTTLVPAEQSARQICDWARTVG